MTVDEILVELKALKRQWDCHVEFYSYNEDYEYARGIENGYEQAADELNDLIIKIEGS